MYESRQYSRYLSPDSIAERNFQQTECERINALARALENAFS